MAATGGFVFHFSATPTSSEARLDMPDQDLAMRYVVVSRRFIDRNDRIYYKAVWDQLLAEFGGHVPVDLKGAVEKLIERISRGDIHINLNGEDVTAETIYNAVAESYVFGRTEQYTWITQHLAQVPMLGPLLWHQFYSYAENVLALASWIVEAIKAVESTEAFKQHYGDPDVACCIYCLQTDGPFRSEEHIWPESMGNNDYVLPRGYVCDPCNNGPLARLDEALRNCPLFITQLPAAVQFDKKGRLPEVRLGNITIRRDDPLNVSWIADPGSDAIRSVGTLADGQTELRFHADLPGGFDPDMLARGLFKVGLAAIAMDFGHEYTCSSRFDRAREFIVHGGDFKNNMLISQWMLPDTSIRLQYYHLPDQTGTPMAHRVYGITLITNLEETPLLTKAMFPREYRLVSFRLFGRRRKAFSLNMKMLYPPD
jgi:hypothetical protein